jgi:4'-phosphopantetheinyl transferase
VANIMVERVDLGDAEVHVWGIDPQQVDDAALLRRYESILSPDEHERRLRLRLERLRHDYLVAHALLRVSLSRYADVAPRDWTFRRSRHGRPEISGPRGAPPLRFNLSHTDGFVACAVTKGRAVGVDVEDRSRSLRFTDVAKRFFAPVEADALDALPEEERRAGFFRLWTLKEAYIKALGLGLAMSLESFWFQFDANGVPSVSFADPGADPRRWRFFLFRPTDRHILALAIEQTSSAATHARLRLAVPFAAGD